MKPMATSDAVREEILKRRAERLASMTNDDKPRRIATQVALVGTGGQRLGLPVETLREIVVLPAITVLPGLPRWMLGITHFRGEIISVVDLAVVLGANADSLATMAVVDGAGGPIGLAFESVLGFRAIYEDEISEPMRADAENPIRAITKDFTTVIDVKRLPIIAKGTSAG